MRKVLRSAEFVKRVCGPWKEFIEGGDDAAGAVPDHMKARSKVWLDLGPRVDEQRGSGGKYVGLAFDKEVCVCCVRAFVFLWTCRDVRGEFVAAGLGF
jgi:hypothetical protein